MEYQYLLNYAKNLSKEILNTEHLLHAAPAENLQWVRNGRYYKYFCTADGSKSYISKKQKDVLDKLAYKRYLQTKLEDLRHEQDCLENLLSNVSDTGRQPHEQLLEDSPISALLTAHYRNVPAELEEWAKAEYEKSNRHPEYLVHVTAFGQKVRSKSESMIATALTMYHIPYHYEELLAIGDMTFAPDFTILHPGTQKLYYWEHAGLMDNSEYAGNFFNKLRIYASHGLILNQNLIVTTETNLLPLTEQTIDDVIRYYFL